MDLFDLVAKITLDSSEYEKGIDSSEAKAKGFGAGLKKAAKGVGVVMTAVTTATAVAGGAFLKGASDAAKAGDEIDKMSQKVGLSAEAYQKWDYVMKISGTEMANMRTGLKTLTNKLDDAKNGSSAAQEMFAKLGISMDDLNKMSREEAFAAAIKGFQGMADSTERAALANDLFGRSGQELTPLFNTSAEETEKLMNNIEELGGIMSDDAVKASAAYVDAMTTLTTVFGGVKNKMMSEFLPSLTTVMEGLSDLFGGKGTEKIEEGLTQFVEKMSEAIPKIFDFGGKIIGALGQAIIQNLPQLIQAGVQTILQFATGIADALPTLIPAMVEAIITMVDALLNNMPMLIKAAVQLVKGLAKGLIKAAPQILAAGVSLMKSLLNGVISGFASIPGKVISLARKIPSAIKTGIGNLASIGRNMIEGLWNGIKGKFDSVVSKVKALAAKLPKAVKKVLGIESPSKVFAEVGKWIPAGLAKGIEDNIGMVEDASDMMADATAFAPEGGTTVGGNTYNFTIYGGDNQPVKDIADAVYQIIVQKEKSRKVAWA